MPKVAYFTRYPIAGDAQSTVFYTVLRGEYPIAGEPQITYFTWSGPGGARKKPQGGQEKPEGAGKAIGSILEPFWP